MFADKLRLALETIADPATVDNRPILFGRHEMMEDLIGRSGEGEEASLPKPHPEVEGASFLHAPNPDLLVALDQRSKLYGLGTHNCVTCQNFRAGAPCPAWAARGRKHILDQPTVEHFSVGNCILVDLLPGLSEGRDPKYPNSPASSNAAYDDLVETVLDNNVFAVYKGGQFQTLTADDLGVDDPLRRTREHEEFMAAGGEDEGDEESWDTGSDWRD